MMPFPALALAVPFLKTWWKVILPVVLLMLALGYVKTLHWQIEHYEAQAVELRLEIAKANEKEKQLEANAKALTEKYKDSLQVKAVEIELNAQDKVKEIVKNEESKRIALSRDVVRLFNSGKPDTKPETVAPAKQTDAPEASPNRTVTLNELLVVSARNDANHQLCIETVGEWQRFWNDYVITYGAVANEP
jgi:hypothetical protein